jgi:thiol-disulfide isomerase/thioredoxin
MRSFLFLLFFSVTISSYGQPKVIKVTDLQQRINNSSDTTYIVNFWATWCAPCVKELPDLDSISREYSSKPLKVLLVTLDFKEDLESKVVPFLNKRHLHAEVLLLDELNSNYFIPLIAEEWSGAIPATLILNNKKKYRNFLEKKINYKLLETEIQNIQNIK